MGLHFSDFFCKSLCLSVLIFMFSLFFARDHMLIDYLERHECGIIFRMFQKIKPTFSTLLRLLVIHMFVWCALFRVKVVFGSYFM